MVGTQHGYLLADTDFDGVGPARRRGARRTL